MKEYFPVLDVWVKTLFDNQTKTTTKKTSKLQMFIRKSNPVYRFLITVVINTLALLNLEK